MAVMLERITEEIGTKDKNQVLKLNLDNCRASGGGVEGLSDDYTALRSLSLNNVELRSLVDFPKLPALKKLELSDNRIMNGLENLVGCTALQSINLSNNKIRHLKHLEPLKVLSELVSLDLESNPVSDLDEYPDALFDLIPQIQFIDDHDRNGDSRPSDDEDDDVSDDDDDDDDESVNSEAEDRLGPLDDDDDDDDDDDGNNNRRDVLNESTGVYVQEHEPERRGSVQSWSSNPDAADDDEDDENLAESDGDDDEQGQDHGQGNEGVDDSEDEADDDDDDNNIAGEDDAVDQDGDVFEDGDAGDDDDLDDEADDAADENVDDVYGIDGDVGDDAGGIFVGDDFNQPTSKKPRLG